MTVDSPALLEARLRGLARAATGAELTGVDTALAVGWSPDEGFVLADDDPRAVGRALRWAGARALPRVHVLATTGAGDLARRARLLGSPSEVTVWSVDGATATEAAPTEPSPPPPIGADHWALASVLSEAGARPVDDHGVVVGEVAGLEVARIADGEVGPTIEVGVGAADRELGQLVHGNEDPGSGLRRVIAAVAEHRRPGSHHPLTRLARERWLRAVLLDDPSAVDAAELRPMVPLRPRRGLVAAQPAAAVGRSADGRPMVVVTVVGVDLDVVPEAADYRLRAPDADDTELVVAMPPRDLKLGTNLLDRLPRARAVALDTPW